MMVSTIEKLSLIDSRIDCFHSLMFVDSGFLNAQVLSIASPKSDRRIKMVVNDNGYFNIRQVMRSTSIVLAKKSMYRDSTLYMMLFQILLL